MCTFLLAVPVSHVRRSIVCFEVWASKDEGINGESKAGSGDGERVGAGRRRKRDCAAGEQEGAWKLWVCEPERGRRCRAVRSGPRGLVLGELQLRFMAWRIWAAIS